MSSLLPSSVPAPELELARTAGRVASRYAAYPPLFVFREGEGEHAHPYVPAQARRGPAATGRAIYLHMPFCYTACAFCSCLKIVTRDGGKAARYLDYLERDIVMQGARQGAGRHIVRMYWGGGTPTYHTMSQLRRVWRALKQEFEFAPDGEYAIEIDPRTVNEASMIELRDMGFTIAGLGVPDLAPPVLEAIGRPQSPEQSLGALAAARRAGFRTVAVDVMYGLPRQTAASFIDTLSAIVAERPDRIVLHDYVHAPRRHKGQRQLGSHELPRVTERLEMLGLAARRLASAAYVHVGPDCFVRADDPLAVAHAAKRLHYDMLGYSAAGETEIVPLGVSAVGATQFTYTQNQTDLGAYYDRLGAGASPKARGIALSPDDVVRRAVMRLLLCQGRVPFAEVESQHSVAFERYFAASLQALAPYAAAGLARIDNRAIVLEPRGRLWARNLCAVFDLHRDAPREARA